MAFDFIYNIIQRKTLEPRSLVYKRKVLKTDAKNKSPKYTDKDENKKESFSNLLDDYVNIEKGNYKELVDKESTDQATDTASKDHDTHGKAWERDINKKEKIAQSDSVKKKFKILDNVTNVKDRFLNKDVLHKLLKVKKIHEEV